MGIASVESIRVLHVDDDRDVAEIAASFLERESEAISVITEPSADDGLDRLAETDVDCVVSDYRMPETDGLEFLEAVREEYPDLPFILFTAQGSEEIASEAISAGVSDYMQKAAGTDQYRVLANRIENLVSRTRAETTYREIFDRASVGMTVRDRDTGELLDVNERYCELLGYAREEALELSMEDISRGEGRYTGERAYDNLQRAVEEDGLQTFEWLNETKDGEEIWVDVSLRLAEIGGEERILASIRDITERKERERALSALHDATRELEDATTVGEVLDTGIDAAESVLGLDIAAFYVVDDGGTTLLPRASTEGAIDLFGTAPPIGEGEGIAWRVYETGEPVIAADVREHPDVFNTETPVRSEIILPLDDRGVFIAGATQVGAFGEAEESLARVLASNVEAAIERAERESLLREREGTLRRQNERLEEFASVVSHDLRGPLDVAKGHLELAAEECDSEHIPAAADAHGRMTELIDAVLELARQGQVISDRRPVELRSAVDAAVANTELDADALTVVADPGTVDGDRERLTALFENLFRNAVEHGGDDVSVRIDSLSHGFFVADDGPGIPPGERTDVFETGYSTTDDGTGFGLAIVESIVAAHGWEIDVTESRTGGARFEITGVEP